jgi:hypothetical protein
MADQLYLSYWVNGYTENNMLRHYERLLKLFPYSRLTRGETTFRVIPVSYAEPALLERPFKSPPDIAGVLAAAKEFQHPDCCYRLETAWDLWQFDTDWEVRPTPVSLCCLGPDFEQDLGENLRIEFGIETHFLPQPDLPNHATMTQSNVKSLLKLVHDLDDALRVEKRLLWTESGENFAEKLQQALAESER